MQIPGWKWFPLLKGFPPPSRAKRGEAQRATRREAARKILKKEKKKINK